MKLFIHYFLILSVSIESMRNKTIIFIVNLVINDIMNPLYFIISSILLTVFMGHEVNVNFACISPCISLSLRLLSLCITNR